MEIDRKKIPYPRLSINWIVEYLSRRGLTTDQFVDIAMNTSQNEISGLYHMQKKDVGKILRILGVDTKSSRTQKIVSSHRLNSMKKKEEIKNNLPSSLLEYISVYGFKDATDKYGKSVVDDFHKIFPDFRAPHASIVRSNISKREVESNKEAIIAMMSEGINPTSIARKLSLNLVNTKKMIYSIDPYYSGKNRTKDDQISTSHKIRIASELRNKESLNKTLAEQTRDVSISRIKDLLFDGIIPTDRSILDNYKLTGFKRGDIQKLYFDKFGIDLKKNKDIFRDIIAGMKRCSDYIATKSLTIDENYIAIVVPDYLADFDHMYRSCLFSRNREYVQNLIKKSKISSGSELVRDYFPFLHFQSYFEGFIIPNNLEFYEKTFEDIAQERFGLSSKELEKSLKESLDKIDGLKQLYALYPNVLPHHIHQAINQLSITIPPLNLSNPETVVKMILDEINPNYETHNRSVLAKKKELDFYYPDLKIAIEVNPTHTHNSTYGFRKSSRPLTPDYHLCKSKEAYEKGVTLIHIYDKDLSNKSKLEAFLRQKIAGFQNIYYGRDVTIEKAAKNQDKTIVREFIEKNHRQGNTGAKVYYKFLNKSGVLIGAASFSPVKSHEADWELKRLCFDSDTQVRFGISKLLSRFKKDEPKAKKLLTYSNIDYGYSDSYEKAGFSLLGETGPSLRWVNPLDPNDSYSWSIATTWGAKNGVIARHLGSIDCSKEEAEDIVTTKLPHRSDDQIGYVKLYSAGSKILIYDFI